MRGGELLAGEEVPAFDVEIEGDNGVIGTALTQKRCKGGNAEGGI